MSIGKIMGKVYQAVTRQRGVQNIVSRVETNTAGRILRMQDAKHAFTLGKNYQSVHIPLKNTSSYNLVTLDEEIGKKLAKMYSKSDAAKYEELSTPEKLAILKKRSDCRAAFTMPTKSIHIKGKSLKTLKF